MEISSTLTASSILSSYMNNNSVDRVSSIYRENQSQVVEYPEDSFEQIQALSQLTIGIRNTNDSATLLQKAESGIQTLEDGITTLREFAVTATSEDSSQEERVELNRQAQKLKASLSESASNVSFNEIPIVSQESDALIIEAQVDHEGNIELGVSSVKSLFAANSFDEINLATEEGALASIEILDNLQADISAAQNRITESSDRLDAYVDDLSTDSVNEWFAMHPASEAVLAADISLFIKDQLNKNRPVFLEVQANASKKTVLGLLKN